jgi:hypothetical protein
MLLDDLFDQMGKCDAGHKLALIDACRNEDRVKAGERRIDAKRVTIPDGVAALFSCGRGQTAWETSKLGDGHGVFFHYVIQGLKGDAKNGEGTVTWDSLSDYVKRQVSRQVPELIGGGASQSPASMGNLEGESPTLTRPDGTLAKDLTNGIGMKLVRIPSTKEQFRGKGTFTMGSTEAERKAVLVLLKEEKMPDWLKAEGPQHEVEITQAFYLGAHEVTQKQFREVMGYNPSYFSTKGD